MNPPDFDVLIAGGGITGNCAALALCNLGISVALLDPGPALAEPSQRYALRVSSINQRSQRFLTDLGVWRDISEMRVSPFSDIEVWDAGNQARVVFRAADAGLPWLGHIVENDVIVYCLERRLDQATGFSRLAQGQLSHIEHHSQQVETITENGDRYSSALLIGADGARSQTRLLSAIGQTLFDYQQNAVVTRVQTELPHGSAARQVFLADGPLAFLPLLDGTCSIVWSVPRKRAQTLLDLKQAQFDHELARAFQHQLGGLQTLQDRAQFPLRRSHAKNYVRDRVVLLGDAAHTVHPLAGLGANQGIADAQVLQETLQRLIDSGRPLDTTRELRRYERARKAANQVTLATMDAFHHLFTQSNPAVTTVRGAGLRLVESSQLLKRFFIQEATGLGNS